MKRFISELRRREVFRTAGLYVGICWIVIEVSSVILPAFGVPEWVFRGAIVAAVAGFPVMLVLAWFFDVQKEGITLQAESPGTLAESPGARKKDFAIIGFLVLALGVSLALNLARQGPDTDASAPRPEVLAVLIADFDITVDEPSFDGAIEEALLVGLETAPQITARRQRALADVDRGAPSASESARDVAQREGIDLLLSGAVQTSGGGFRISVEGVDVESGETVFEEDETAASPERVLPAIAKLSATVRDALDQPTPDVPPGSAAGSFSAASLQAAHAYAAGRQSERAGDVEQAATFYAQAIALDSRLGRAYTNLALAEYALGREDDAAAHWATALSLTDTMTQREQLRALGRYAIVADADAGTAAKAFAELVAKYPADADGHAALASSSFRSLDVATAIDETRALLEIFPAEQRAKTQLALYAMYQGDWETAADEAGQVIAADPAQGTAYLPVAVAALARGQVDAARDAYQGMAAATRTGHGASAAVLGLADIDLYLGAFDAAQQRLRAGIDADIDAGAERMAALKSVALAQSLAELGNLDEATTAVTEARQLADDNAIEVPAAMIYLDGGDVASAQLIADDLDGRADPHSRAYGRMLTGLILERAGKQTDAILALRDAIDIADLWLIRLQVGEAYMRAGNYLEALDELTTLNARRGEATSVFLDDMPTYRVLAELPYWRGRVQEALDSRAAAGKSYAEFISLRPQGGVLAEDAAARAARLE